MSRDRSQIFMPHVCMVSAPICVASFVWYDEIGVEPSSEITDTAERRARSDVT